MNNKHVLVEGNTGPQKELYHILFLIKFVQLSIKIKYEKCEIFIDDVDELVSVLL